MCLYSFVDMIITASDLILRDILWSVLWSAYGWHHHVPPTLHCCFPEFVVYPLQVRIVVLAALHLEPASRKEHRSVQSHSCVMDPQQWARTRPDSLGGLNRAHSRSPSNSDCKIQYLITTQLRMEIVRWIKLLMVEKSCTRFTNAKINQLVQ